MNKKNCHYSCTLNEVCHEITVGFVGSMTQEYISEGIPLLRSLNIKPYKLDLTNIKYISKEFHQKIRKSALKKGDVVVVRTGQPGTSCVIPDEFDGLNCSDLVVARPNPEKIDSYYLAFYLNSMAKQYIGNQLVGAIQQHFNIRSAKEMIIHLPSLNEQLKISKVLNDLNTKIEVNNKINAELEAMAKLIYDYWFVQFDFPFDFAQGKPDPKGKPYKSSGGKMVYNKELKREIPEGWEIGNLLNIANITTGKLDSNAEVENGAYYFYTCAVNPTKTDTYAFEDSVILIAGNNAAGNFHVNRFTGRFNAYQRTYVITAKEDKHLDYLYQVLLEQMKLMKTRGNGSQTKFLTIGMLNSIPVFKSNSIVVDEFSKITIPMYQKQVNLMNENQKLSELRDWLLPMLMNGQVTVANEELGITNVELGNDLGMVAEEAGNYKLRK